ncbi:MAG: ThuA domain-containing protein [Alicyclobacillus sp.]|nr:ThuA domain-containing protein [Alicyclobacillus sp.]
MAGREALAIIGDYYHPRPLIETALRTAFAPLAAEGWTLVLGEIGELADRLEQNPGMGILFKEDRQTPTEADVKPWMTNDAAAAIERYVASGGSWLAWHSGLAGYAVPGTYTSMLRGHFDMHPYENKVVQYTPEPHPISHGVEPFEFLDEHYFVTCDEANTSVFLRSASPDGTSIAGWAHAFAAGRVCCLTPAHRSEGLTNQAFLDVLTQCLRWCARLL